MFVISFRPAQFTDGFFALGTAELRLFADLLPSSTWYIIILLPVTHSAVATTHTKVNTDLTALISFHTGTAFVLNDYLPLLLFVRNTSSEIMQTEVALVAFTRNELSLTHPIWPH